MGQKSTGHLLSLITPAYREEKRIVRSVQEMKRVLDKIRYAYEIIVVFDGQVDNSEKLLQRQNIPNVQCYSYAKNQGKGYALRFGMTKAKGDLIMIMDSGGEIDANGISMLLEHMEWYDADIIVGSKRHPASIVNYTPARKLMSYLYYLIVKMLFRLNIRDTQAGIKIFRKAVLKKILPRLLEKRFCADLEMLVVAKQFGFNRIFEAPIKLNYRFSRLTTAATLKSIRGIILDTAAIFYRAKLLRYYNRKNVKRH